MAHDDDQLAPAFGRDPNAGRWEPQSHPEPDDLPHPANEGATPASADTLLPAFGRTSDQPSHVAEPAAPAQPSSAAYLPPAQPASVPQPVGVTPPPPAAPSHSEPASTTADQGSWPLPDRQLTALGTALPVELAVVAGVYALAGLWLLWAARDVFDVLGRAIGFLWGSSSAAFLFAWAAITAALFVLYLIAGLFAIAWLLLQRDRLGRALSALVTGLLLVIVSDDGTLGASGVVVLLVSALCTTVLFVSPWCKRAFREGTRNDGRPAPVLLSVTLAVTLFSLLAVVGVVMLLGLRFIGDLPVSFVFATLLVCGGAVLGGLGVLRLWRGPDQQGRLFVTVAAAVLLVGLVVTGSRGGFGFPFVVLLTIVLPLWVAPSVRRWFGEKPLNITGYETD